MDSGRAVAEVAGPSGQGLRRLAVQPGRNVHRGVKAATLKRVPDALPADEFCTRPESKKGQAEGDLHVRRRRWPDT
jgi:hypothetical protein